MPYAVREEKYVHNAAEHPDTTTLLRIPLNIGKLPSFATLLRLSIKCLPGMTNDNDPDGSKKAAKKRAKEERRRARS